jgi:flagellar biosynthesis protein FlhG
MRDQAEALRVLMREKSLCCGGVINPPRVFTVAVTSGKGGVGKTSLAVNLALLLSRSGRRVRLVDADFGLSNAEVMLGLKPRYTLRDVLAGNVDVRDAWIEGLLLSSGSGMEDVANIDASTGLAVLEQIQLSATDGDVIVIDTSPGINDSVTALLTFADEVMMVTTPEPTSITDSYAAIKVLMSRSSDSDVTLVVNCCSSPTQAAAIADGLDRVCKRFLRRSFSRHEYLPQDVAMGWAVKTQKPLALSSSHSTCESWLRKIAIRLDERMRNKIAEAAQAELVRA